MHITRFTDAAQFYEVIKPALLVEEAANNIIFGIVNRLIDVPDYYENPYFAVIEQDGQIMGVAMRTPPYNALIASITHPRAVPLFVNDLIDFFNGSIRGVQANTALARLFADLWHERTGQSFAPYMKLRIYQLDAVTPPTDIPGHMITASEAYHPLLIDWINAFHHDALGDQEPVDAEKSVDNFLTNPSTSLHLWLVNGEPVSMAGNSGPTENGSRVSAVYTPPGHRRKGYASAVVAALSQHLLDQGSRFCFLFTDLTNPTSNSIYQKIGYNPVCDVDSYLFTEDTP